MAWIGWFDRVGLVGYVFFCVCFAHFIVFYCFLKGFIGIRHPGFDFWVILNRFLWCFRVFIFFCCFSAFLF